MINFTSTKIQSIKYSHRIHFSLNILLRYHNHFCLLPSFREEISTHEEIVERDFFQKGICPYINLICNINISENYFSCSDNCKILSSSSSSCFLRRSAFVISCCDNASAIRNCSSISPFSTSPRSSLSEYSGIGSDV